MTERPSLPDPHPGLTDRIGAALLPRLYSGEPTPPCLIEVEPEAEI